MSVIELTIPPREKDLGGFFVRRLLPFAKRRMVGPFIFFDHMGPAHFPAGQGIDVRPHPHIGLATVTYLFEGEIFHRDTLGTQKTITPGDVNWMTAGGGIAHSERTAPVERSREHNVHGIQSWVALPKEYEDMPPEFFHYPAESLPVDEHRGTRVRVIAGEAFGHRAPVKTFSPLFYAEARMEAGSTLELPPQFAERALHLVSGDVSVGGERIEPMAMPVLVPEGTLHIEAAAPSLLMLLGGEALPEARYIEWNFVSSDPEKIVAAKEKWRAQKFGTIAGDDKEFIPLPA